MKKLFRFYVGAFALIAGLTAASATAQTAPSTTQFPHVKIKNFGQMDEHYFRGGQPKKDQYQALKELGINTVVDLRNDSTDYEKSTVEALGMKYINVPMDDGEYPSESTIAKFLEVINDPTNGKMFVHCKGGRHRAGVTGAAYRFTKYGWDYERVMKEMENYRFDTSYGRDEMKQFVVDYAEKMRHQVAAASAPAAKAN